MADNKRNKNGKDPSCLDPSSSSPAAKCPVTDVVGSLKEIAAALRSRSRKKKLDPVKQSLLEKGFDVDKEKRNAKRVGKYRYPTRLQTINDARAEAARQRRLTNSDYKNVISESLTVAEKIIEERKREKFKRIELERFSNRPYRSFTPFKRNPYEFNQDTNYVEVVPTKTDDTPVFKNKVEEAIYRLKNKK